MFVGLFSMIPSFKLAIAITCGAYSSVRGLAWLGCGSPGVEGVEISAPRSPQSWMVWLGRIEQILAIYMFIYISIYLSACLFVWMYVCMYVCLSVCPYVCCMYACMYVYIYVYMYTGFISLHME